MKDDFDEGFKFGIAMTIIVCMGLAIAYKVHSDYEEKNRTIQELQQKIAENKVP